MNYEGILFRKKNDLKIKKSYRERYKPHKNKQNIPQVSIVKNRTLTFNLVSNINPNEIASQMEFFEITILCNFTLYLS